MFRFLCFLGLLLTNAVSGGRAMMTVGDIQAWHLCELLGDSVDIALVADNPELVTETVDRRDEIVDGSVLAYLLRMSLRTLLSG